MNMMTDQGESPEDPEEGAEGSHRFGPVRVPATAVPRVTEPSKRWPWTLRESLFAVLAAGGITLALVFLTAWRTNLIPYESEWGTVADWFMVGISALGTLITTIAIGIAALTYVRGEQDARRERAELLSAEDEALLHFTSKFRETINTEIQTMTDEASLIYFWEQPVAIAEGARFNEYRYAVQIGVWNRTGKHLRNLKLEVDEPLRFQPSQDHLLASGNNPAERLEAWNEWHRRRREEITLGAGPDAWRLDGTYADHLTIGNLYGDYVGRDRNADNEYSQSGRYWSESRIEGLPVRGHQDRLAGKMRLTFTLGAGPEWILVYGGSKPAVPVIRSQFVASQPQDHALFAQPSQGEIKLDPVLDAPMEDRSK
jgi:hypothetical protein